ncbi:MAG: response regulator [Cyanobacteria bacterium SZAS-4]|nr:response regulator [Cyanobacteria bacterium SZAS-4]
MSETGNKSKINHVLIVDDDDNIRLITQMSLEGLTTWKVQEARSGKEALTCLAGELPDVILLDVMMPDMTGMDVFGQAKTLLGDNLPRVIFMTAKVQASEIEKYRALGAAGVIMKPFDPMKLPEQIEEAFSHFS